MKLNVKDRMLLFSILPREGDIVSLKLLRKVREDLALSEVESKKYVEAQLPNGNTLLQGKYKTTKDIHVGDVVMTIIVAKLEELNKAKKLHEDHIGLYERFIEKEPAVKLKRVK